MHGNFVINVIVLLLSAGFQQCLFLKFSLPHQDILLCRRLHSCIQCFSLFKISHFYKIPCVGVDLLIKWSDKMSVLIRSVFCILFNAFPFTCFFFWDREQLLLQFKMFFGPTRWFGKQNISIGLTYYFLIVATIDKIKFTEIQLEQLKNVDW